MSAVIAIAVIAIFALALRFYARFLDRRLFLLRADAATPGHTHHDAVDFCPTRPLVLFGHHFASICGLGPIVGPAVAVIWGWVPALLWIVLGVVLIGAVHDFGSLVVSVRHDGRSIGDLTNDLIGPRARLMFLVLIFFMVALAMGLFASIIATLFQPEYYPAAVLPAFLLIGIAVVVGVMVQRKPGTLTMGTVAGFVLMLASLPLGQWLPITGIAHTPWVFILLVYAFIASALPVWMLLQPRDYLNSLLLYLGIGLMYAGIFIQRPDFVAPAFNSAAADLPPLFPFLFITVACGATSGFHSLVCSGTTSKQLDKETHARAIGYGGMLAEALMAVAVLIACTAGMASSEAWQAHYASWTAIKGLGPSMNVFIDGAAGFVAQTGVPMDLARVFIAVTVVGFAMTTLDSATRLLRYNIEEFGRTLNVPALQNRYTASGLAVAAIGYFALMKSGKALWQLFGTTNQLLAALALLAVTVYLAQRKRPIIYTALPMVFMFVTTVTAMLQQLPQFMHEGHYSLAAVTVVMLLLSAGLVVEAGRKLLTEATSDARRATSERVG